MFSSFLCLFLISYASCQDLDLSEGEKCFSQRDKINGTCVSSQRCVSVLYDIKEKTRPQICSFKGEEAIICCTDCQLVEDTRKIVLDKHGNQFTKSEQKAVNKCVDYLSSLNYYCLWENRLRKLLLSVSQKENGICFFYRPVQISAYGGGADADRDEYPHMALLGYGDDLESAQWLCGGSVISDRYILTAAHCISSAALEPVRYVALGILKRTDPSATWQRYTVSRIIPHPQYQSPSKYHDIALLEVDTKINFSRQILPACLHTGDSDARYVTGTGWGALGNRQPQADTLQVVNLEEFTAEECGAAYPPHRLLVNGYDHATQSCYGYKQKFVDSCQGDSGGPLQVSMQYGRCTYKIVGVTSFGRQCGVKGNAGIYTRVSYYVPWIESVVWP